ncbi:Phosphate starvation-inducible protein PhoH, predicted ATPase [Candidatus Sumerlaea chitinivorans]|uniref:PhoH-like protein n=1 Tax=Sumerlaea chitinivorans TaxID=2250252 RepID=A0A2Z4Y8M4_SUMC1|nr:Phosphate starvation-inducible protein PhoH, predicted ATPase [Candidatus Sumerlaea chitinivorans]
MSELSEHVVELSQSELLDFCGKNDEKLRELEAQFDVRIVPRGNTIKIMGEPEKVGQACQLVEHLLSFSRSKNGLSKHQVRYAIRSIKEERKENLREIFSDRVTLPLKKRGVSPMTAGQKRYLDAIRTCDIVFGIGPAGTGKTYLAMAMAVHHLIEKMVRRIILVRPAVEAGEKLGFLPGDIAAKFDPFVRPLYDALFDMVEPERARELMENGTVEIAPLAFMRGRTLNSAFVILDEGQNTSIEQMKMFLTRLGNDSKAVITGDITQIDLPAGKESGLVHAQRILSSIEGIAFVYFDETDVVRHELIQKIIRAYDAADRGGVQPELPLDGVGTERINANGGFANGSKPIRDTGPKVSSE